MDWRKAKSQIIMILLVLNIVLSLFLLYNKSSRNLYQNSDLTIIKLEKKLKNYGIDIDTKIPTSLVNKKPLIVKYQEEAPESINQAYFNGEGKLSLNDQITRISKGQEEINIINNRRFLYENFSNASEKGENSKTKAIEFLKNRGYETSDMVNIKVEKEGNQVTYEFAKIYNDRILETSYTRITLKEGQVTKMDRLWIEVIEEDPKEINIEPAYKALFSLIGREELKGEKIISIKTCYYFNPEEQGLLEDNTKAEQGRAIPAWRIVFESGKSVVVDNF